MLVIPQIGSLSFGSVRRNYQKAVQHCQMINLSWKNAKKTF